MLLKIINSKADMYGNRYWMVQLKDANGVIKEGRIGCNNINMMWCRDNDIIVDEIELPIREFNKMQKGLEWFGSQWEEIQDHLFN